MYKLQIAEVDNAERPEYEHKDNPNWETILEGDTAEYLLCEITTWLNDENYPTNQWVRILKDNIVLESGLTLKTN